MRFEQQHEVGVKILITGATGTLGHRLGQWLVRHNHQVVALVRDKEKAQKDLPYPCECILWGQDLPKDIEAVIHLAGEGVADKRWSDKRKKELTASRVELTHKLVSEIISQNIPVKTWIQASAVGYYGDGGERWLRETSPAQPTFLSQLCVEWEKASSLLPVHVRRICLRIGMILEWDRGFLGRVVPLFRRGLGSPLGSGEQWMSWIHVDDLCRMILFSIENDRVSGPYNAVSPHPLKNKDATEILAQKLDAMNLSVGVPEAALQTVYGEMAHMMLASQKVSSEKMILGGFRFLYPQFQDAIEHLVSGLEKNDDRLIFEQYIPKKRKELFPFFSVETNLEELTPPSLNFKVVNKTSEKIHEGTELSYKLKVHGIPLDWTSKIINWNPSEGFSDTQIKGPYKKWHHEHLFQDLGEGCLMRDIITYQLPMGWLGEVLGSYLVKKDLKKIFDYRRKVIYERFH